MEIYNNGNPETVYIYQLILKYFLFFSQIKTTLEIDSFEKYIHNTSILFSYNIWNL